MIALTQGHGVARAYSRCRRDPKTDKQPFALTPTLEFRVLGWPGVFGLAGVWGEEARVPERSHAETGRTCNSTQEVCNRNRPATFHVGRRRCESRHAATVTHDCNSCTLNYGAQRCKKQKKKKSTTQKARGTDEDVLTGCPLLSRRVERGKTHSVVRRCVHATSPDCSSLRCRSPSGRERRPDH